MDNILNEINLETTIRGFHTSETFILNLIKIHLSKENKILEIKNSFFDAYAPEGLGNITGPTHIDVKFNLERIPYLTFLNKMFYLFNEAKVDFPEVKNILVISPYEISKKKKEKYNYYLKNYPFKLYIWGPKEINEIALNNKEEVKEIRKNLFSLRIESAVIQKSKDWKKEREEKIKSLKLLYEKGQFSFFLGAGVSSSAGMPDWNNLLNSLFVSYLTNEFDTESQINDSDIKEIVSRLNQIDEPSALMAARYLRKGLDSNIEKSEEFTKTITNNLYKLRNTDKKIDSELVKSIVQMCIPLRTGAKIKSVITYNFDDLLERQLKSQSIKHLSIYSDNDYIDPNQLPIYHVHGFLPEKNEEYDNLEKSTLVFSEEGYHLIYSDAYHWSNLVQLSNLRDNSCLMVGLSMTDPNLRRLLDIASRNTEKTKHFTFMKRLSLESFVKDKKQKIIKNTEGAKKFLERHHNLNEEIMRELGVSIIWYTDYDEIPEILKQIRT